jgi:hypothetical protein
LVTGFILYFRSSSAISEWKEPEKVEIRETITKGDDSPEGNNFQQEQVDPCLGKEKVIQILHMANVTVDKDLCFRLPSWQSVADLYGDQPVVVGMDTCRAYRDLIQAAGVHPMPRVGGLYNTGTNALAWTFLENIENIGEKDLRGNLHPYELPWGKHTSPVHRLNVTFPKENKESHVHALPIVLIRDPYRWMSGMCKKSYFIKWKSSGQCPSLVTASDHTTVRVEVKPPPLNGDVEIYESLADLWSLWNGQYLDADFPRLIVRFEDYLFHTKEVFDHIVRCTGMRPNVIFRYHTEPAKVHGASTDFLSAIIKYGTSHGRSKGLLDADLEYASSALDSRLMRMFHYKHPRS